MYKPKNTQCKSTKLLEEPILYLMFQSNLKHYGFPINWS